MALYCCTLKGKGEYWCWSLFVIPVDLCWLRDAFILRAVTPLSLLILPLKICYPWWSVGSFSSVHQHTREHHGLAVELFQFLMLHLSESRSATAVAVQKAATGPQSVWLFLLYIGPDAFVIVFKELCSDFVGRGMFLPDCFSDLQNILQWIYNWQGLGIV